MMSSPSEAEAVAIAQAEIEKQETKVKEAEAKVEKAKGEVQQAETKVEKAEAKVDKAKKEVKEAIEEVKVAHTGGSELEKEAQKGLDSAQKGLDSAQKGLDSAQKGLDSAQKGLDSAQEGVKTAQKLLSIAAASLERASGAVGAGAAGVQGTAQFDMILAKVEETRQSVLTTQKVVFGLVIREQQNLMNPRASTERSHTSQIEFKRALVKHYENGVDQEQNMRSSPEDVKWKTLKCLVTGEVLAYGECHAAHLFPHENAHQLDVFGLEDYDINSVSNGLLWATGIEEVWSSAKLGVGQVCIIHDFLHDELKFFVLNPDLKPKLVKPTKMTFASIHGTSLCVPKEKFPSLRFLWTHAHAALKMAGTRHWITPTDDQWKMPMEMMERALSVLNDPARELISSRDAARIVAQEAEPGAFAG